MRSSELHEDLAVRIRYKHFGQGEHERTESVIRTLLAAMGRGVLLLSWSFRCFFFFLHFQRSTEVLSPCVTSATISLAQSLLQP